MTAPVRPCPFCAADIAAEDSLCGGCGRFSRPVASSSPRRGPPLTRINGTIAKWEAAHADSITHVLVRAGSLSGLPNGFRLAFGGGLALLSLPLLAQWLRYGGYASFRGAAALLLLGVVMLTWPRLSKPREAHDAATADLSFRLLGCNVDLLGAQFLAATVATITALLAEIDEALWAAVVTVALTPILYGTRRFGVSLAVGAVAAFYLLYLLAVWDIGYRISSDAYARSFPVFILPLGSIAWITLIFALLPQLGLVRLGGFSVGGLRGDTAIQLGALRVSLPVASAVLLSCAWEAAWLLFYLPGWLPSLLD